MGKEDSDAESTSAIPQGPLMIGVAIVSALVLLLAILTLFLIIDMRGDLATVAEQSKKALKASKAIEEDLAEMQKTMPKEKAAAAIRDRPAEPRPMHIDGVDTSNDCVIRPGSGKGLADCLGQASK